MLTRSKTKENGEEFKYDLGLGEIANFSSRDPDLYDQQADYGF